ncbi:L,D-transpeptidase family protein [Niabella beijingensis]|uniref:L,D-transpeptidase family protein n=1 Tax=Niabella beijingensis TaxID=2872700 RepID=UPI001CBD6AA7|nr:L,D-transpeptidase family protein [Niabella beijingensis]MBZ4191631.1 L,D-transpeptidase family protein [Niabella beijingensis]
MATSTNAQGRFISRPLSNPSMVDAFYRQREGRLFWFGAGAGTEGTMRNELIRIFKEEAVLQGLDSLKYLSMLPATIADLDSSESEVCDRMFTDAAFAYFADLYGGDPRVRTRVGSDEITGKYGMIDRQYIVDRLSEVNSSALLKALVPALEPSQPLYLSLKDELQKQLELGDRKKIASLVISLNNFRWFCHFRFKNFIVVNIASAELNYFEQDSVILNMRIVAGKPSTMTPRFVTYCDQVILYPYWNVPRSIAVNEILPFCKKSLVVLDILKMQVINSKGEIVDPKRLDWKKFTAKNFPYRFRQSTGCDNALGVIKFNLTSPYSVYLHDTNLKSDFKAEKRYFSHGCIRIEQPLELANEILEDKLDEGFLKASIKGQQPIAKKVAEPVPVFVLYMTAEATASGAVKYFPDVYGLL